MFKTTKLDLFSVCRFQINKGKRHYWSTKSITAFCELFDLDRDDFTKFRKVNNIPPLTIRHVEEMSSLCETLNLNKQEWLQHPGLIKRAPSVSEQFYLNLKEGGFRTVDVRILASYGSLVKNTIQFLKIRGYIEADVNVAERFLSHFNPKPQVYIGDLTDDYTFRLTHHSILTRFLMWRFNETYERVQKLFRMYSLAKVLSFEQLMQSLQFAEQLGCSDKIWQYGYILKTPPKQIESLLVKVPTLAGLDICKIVTICPQLIRIPAEKLLETYKILKDAHISDSVIQKDLNIFNLQPATIQERLEEVSNIPEFNVYRNHPKFLKLIITHNEARSRLSFLKKLKLRCASAEYLCNTKQRFNMYIQEGKDFNGSREVVSYVKRLLRCNTNLISTNLKKHLFYRHVPFVSINDSYKYLQELNFDNNSIIEVVQLLLYPRSTLQSGFEAASACTKDLKLGQTVSLNLVLYLIEKEHHFTGNGIWNDTENA